jgi:hypothetical protein
MNGLIALISFGTAWYLRQFGGKILRNKQRLTWQTHIFFSLFLWNCNLSRRKIMSASFWRAHHAEHCSYLKKCKRKEWLSIALITSEEEKEVLITLFSWERKRIVDLYLLCCWKWVEFISIHRWEHGSSISIQESISPTFYKRICADVLAPKKV